MNKSWLTMAAVAGIVTANGQEPITITVADMFNAPGQYYRAYLSKNVGVAGMIGTASDAVQAWDFTDYVSDETVRHDFLDPMASGYGDAFPEATLGERIRIDGEADRWMLVDWTAGRGRMIHAAELGSEGLLPPGPAAATPPFVDFPEMIELNDTWSYGTEFETSIMGVPAKLIFTTTAKVDAFGFISLPSLGFGNCLRVNMLNELSVQIDLDLTGNYQTLTTEYYRSYFWLRPEHGIVAEVHSQQLATPPPDDFAVASAIEVQFELDHPAVVREPQQVEDLKISRGDDQVLLTWSEALNVGSYRVERTSTPGDEDSWVELITTEGNFVIDDLVADRAHRFYRIVSLP